MSRNVQGHLKVYNESDFDRIAEAIDKSAPHVAAHANEFDAAAMWYRMDSRDPRQVAPSVLKRKITSVSRAAKRLLKSMGIKDIEEAADGPGNLTIFDALASVEDASPDTVASATNRIGRLAAVLDGIEAARELDHLVKEAIKNVERIGKLTVPEGHHGNTAVNHWTAAMLSTYQTITKCLPRTSIASPGRHNEKEATGPLIRFLTAAGKPLSIRYSAKAWRSRIRGILENSR